MGGSPLALLLMADRSFDRPRYSIFGWMLRKGRLYEIPAEEVVAEGAEGGAASENDEKSTQQACGAKAAGSHASIPVSAAWVALRDQELFEWMLGGRMSAESFFEQYWEQEPLLVQHNRNQGTAPSLSQESPRLLPLA